MSITTSPATITTRACILCGKEGSVALTAAEAEALSRGEYVHDALAQRSRATREQIISGTHPECWADMFGTDE